MSSLQVSKSARLILQASPQLDDCRIRIWWVQLTNTLWSSTLGPTLKLVQSCDLQNDSTLCPLIFTGFIVDVTARIWLYLLPMNLCAKGYGGRPKRQFLRLHQVYKKGCEHLSCAWVPIGAFVGVS